MGKRRKQKRICEHCSKEFETEWKNAIYCSKECQYNAKFNRDVIPQIESGICSSPIAQKKYLRLKEGDMCKECGLNAQWNSKPLMLQLDHIDGNSDNNFPSNLRLLCPNCHSQTPTYNGKNIKDFSYLTKRSEMYRRIYKERIKTKECNVCKKETTNKKYCSLECCSIGSRICQISTEDLYQKWLDNGKNFLKTSRECGISDNALRKRIRKLLK